MTSSTSSRPVMSSSQTRSAPRTGRGEPGGRRAAKVRDRDLPRQFLLQPQQRVGGAVAKLVHGRGVETGRGVEIPSRTGETIVRHLIVSCDGTWNTSDQGSVTAVKRLYDALA